MAKAKAKAKAVPPALAEIETLTRGYAAERDTLGALVRQLQEARAEQDARFMPAIREAISMAREPAAPASNVPAHAALSDHGMRIWTPPPAAPPPLT